MSAMIELRGASRLFSSRGGPVPALLPTDLVVTEGEFVCLVGPSGCGKSTVLNMVAGLLPPSAGRVSYGGAPVSGPNWRVGYMTQKDTLLPWRTVADNVGVALELRIRRVGAAERARRVADMIELVGLRGFERHYPAQLSGGMRKRVALARSLIYEPETLLMDEPFGALDAQLKLVMQGELMRVAAASGVTVVFVTHDLGEAIALADRVLVFSGRPGRVKAERTVPLPRPRDPARVRFTPEFAALHEELWELLAPEVAPEMAPGMAGEGVH